MKTAKRKIALITGASRGFGLALAHALAKQEWQLVINARQEADLLRAQQSLEQWTKVLAISGDIIDEIHLLQLAERINELGTIDLLVNNASTLGATPLPALMDLPIPKMHRLLHTNVIAPLSLLQRISQSLSPTATIVNISSDAGKEAYPGWGGYGASKAALDHLTAILAVENPAWKCYAFDPGDMRTQMHQEAFPGEDISDRPLPESIAVPALLKLLEEEAPSGRYTAETILSPAV